MMSVVVDSRMLWECVEGCTSRDVSDGNLSYPVITLLLLTLLLTWMLSHYYLLYNFYCIQSTR